MGLRSDRVYLCWAVVVCEANVAAWRDMDTTLIRKALTKFVP